MRVKKSVDIAAPPENVWPYLEEPERILDWYLPLRKFEYTGDSRASVGAPFRFEEEVPGRQLKLDCEITEWLENEVVAFAMVSGNAMKSYGERWTVEATPTGSRFTIIKDGELPYGILGRLVTPIAERGSAATIDRMLKKLKELVEASKH